MASLPTIPFAALAEKSGIPAKIIKSYEQMGLLSRPRRVSGLPLYPPEEVDRITLVNSALQLGFSTATVRRLLGVGRRGRGGCADVYVIAERHLNEVRRRRADLERIERLLAPLVEACPRRGPVDACNIIATLSHPGSPFQGERAGKRPGVSRKQP
jgi:MerR family transcriptional regulator, mercuric resistance operon regulatory protein